MKPGYLLTLMLGVAALVTICLRLHREERLAATVQSLKRGELVLFFDELSSGRLGDAWRRSSETAFSGRLAAYLPPPWQRQLDQAAGKVRSGSIKAGERGAATDVGKDASTGRERPPPEDPHLFDPEHRLDVFFRTLRARERGKRAKVRILYFGTSEIGHDRVTSQIRRRLQERFGDGGKGWVLIDRTWAILDHRDIAWRHDEPNWKSYSIRTGAVEDGHYGLGGVLVKSVGPAWVQYETVDDEHGVAAGYHEFPAGTAWSRAELHYQSHPAGGIFAVNLDGKRPTKVSTKSAKVRDEIFAVRLKDGAHRLRLDVVSQSVHMYGAIFERKTGLVLDALMVIGAWGNSIKNFDPVHLKQQLNRRAPALIVLQFGAKEALRFPELSQKQLAEFAAGYQASVDMVMADRKNAACLIVSPKDQAYEIGGRIETRPAVAKLVSVAQEVARTSGCAFYNLFESMGGEGTARRWYHQTPRLISSDFGHLEEPGSIRIGDILGDLLLDEYDAFLAWTEKMRARPDTADRVAGVSVKLRSPTTAALSTFQSGAKDEPLRSVRPCLEAGREAVDCRDPMTYIRTNERGQPLWAPHIRKLRGGYVGLGADENYSLIVEAGSRWAWLLDEDPTIVYLHEIIRAVVLGHATPREFAGAFASGRAAETRQLIENALTESRFGADERSRIQAVFDDIRPELERHFRRSCRARPLFPNWGWLTSMEKYSYVRAMFEQGRIRTVLAELEGPKALKTVAASASAMKIPIRVVYVSNAEDHFKKLPEGYRENIRNLPFDSKSVVLRTTPGRRWNRRKGFSKWHYVIHKGKSFQTLLARPRFSKPEDAMKDRKVLSDHLSLIGPKG